MFENCSSEYIDLEALLANCANKEDLVMRLLTLFLQQAPLWLKDIDEAFQSQDVMAVRAVCHRVKGGAGTVQAKKICAMTEKLSEAAKKDQLSEADEIVSMINTEINATIAFVESLLQK